MSPELKIVLTAEEKLNARVEGAYFERDALLTFGDEYIKLKERKGERQAAQHVAEFLANIEKNAHVAGLRKKNKGN